MEEEPQKRDKIADSLIQSLKEVALIRQGKLKIKTWDQFISELTSGRDEDPKLIPTPE